MTTEYCDEIPKRENLKRGYGYRIIEIHHRIYRRTSANPLPGDVIREWKTTTEMQLKNREVNDYGARVAILRENRRNDKRIKREVRKYIKSLFVR